MLPEMWVAFTIWGELHTTSHSLRGFTYGLTCVCLVISPKRDRTIPYCIARQQAQLIISKSHLYQNNSNNSLNILLSGVSGVYLTCVYVVFCSLFSESGFAIILSSLKLPKLLDVSWYRHGFIFFLVSSAYWVSDWPTESLTWRFTGYVIRRPSACTRMYPIGKVTPFNSTSLGVEID